MSTSSAGSAGPAGPAGGAPRRLLAGVDVGSANTKVGLFGVDGVPVVRLVRPTPRGQGGQHYDAERIVRVVLDCLAECVSVAGTAPEAIGVASMAETGVALDADLKPLHPMLSWADGRAAAQTAWLDRELGAVSLAATTGLPVHARHPLPKWLWLRENAAGVLRKTRCWVSVADLVALALTGELSTNVTLAQRTMAFDVRSGEFDADLLALAGLRRSQLPPVLARGEVTGQVTESVAVGTGLYAGTPVVIAGHDHLVGAYAAGVRAPGQLADSAGSTEAVIAVADRLADPSALVATGTSAGRYVDGSRWCMIGELPGSGALAEWFVRRMLAERDAGEDAVKRFIDLVAESTERPTGVVVEPYLHGCAAPQPRPHRRLALRGVTERHNLADLAAAVLEGTAFHARWVSEEIAAITNVLPARVTVLGGERLPGWAQIKAAVNPWPTTTVNGDPTLVGAALLAAPAAGLASVDPGVERTEVTAGPVVSARYEALYRRRFLPPTGEQFPARR
ncbi:FGGY-family carbohydrate kinase [Allokutzneria multivorans]|uniref:FGGY-family carbohydrate kinase n=1 Tax=Allokutzneria multivorans TaxID=1142134 RepID=A0ABP7S710_9PSEU